MTKSRKCDRCHKEKAISEFTKNPMYADGRRSWCKTCVAKDLKTVEWAERIAKKPE